MLQGEHSAIVSTFIKLPFVIKIFVLYIFEWPFYTGFTVLFLEIVMNKLTWILRNKVVLIFYSQILSEKYLRKSHKC